MDKVTDPPHTMGRHKHTAHTVQLWGNVCPARTQRATFVLTIPIHATPHHCNISNFCVEASILFILPSHNLQSPLSTLVRCTLHMWKNKRKSVYGSGKCCHNGGSQDVCLLCHFHILLSCTCTLCKSALKKGWVHVCQLYRATTTQHSTTTQFRIPDKLTLCMGSQRNKHSLDPPGDRGGLKYEGRRYVVAMHLPHHDSAFSCTHTPISLCSCQEARCPWPEAKR